MATPYNKNRHDLGLLKQDGTTIVGLMLERDENKIPIYEVVDDEYLAQQQTNQAGYEGLPYEKEIRMGQDDWSGGFAQEIYDRNEPNKYLSSTGVEARQPHQLLGGGSLSEITYPVLPVVADGGFETWTDPNTLTNWTLTQSSGTLTQGTTTNKYAGTYSACLSVTGSGGGEYARINTPQVTTNIANVQGKYFSVFAYVKTGTASFARIGIKTDGSGGTTTYSSYHTGGGAWELLSAGVTVPADATYVQGWCLVEDDAVTSAYFDTFTFSAYGVGAPYCIEEFNSSIYLAAGKCLLKVASDGTCTFSRGFSDTITCIKRFTDGNLYIALGLSTAYEYMSTAEAFTTSTAAVKYFNYFEQLDATSPTLYGSDSVNTIRSTTNPANAGVAWSAQTTIDTAEWYITCLKQANNSLFIMKGNRPYYLDTDGNVKTLTTITDSLASNTYGGFNTAEWQGRLYMPYGNQGLLEYDIANGSFDWKQPTMSGKILQYYIKSVAGDDQYLYAIDSTGSSNRIYTGRYQYDGGVSKWVWHQTKDWTSAPTVYGGIISAAYSFKKYFITTSSTTTLYYILPPIRYGDLSTVSSGNVPLSGTTITTPWLHGEFKNDKKAFVSVTCNLGHAYNANRYWTCEYQLVGDSSWTSLGNFVGSATSMTQTIYFSTTSKPSSTMIRLRFTNVTSSLVTHAILNSYSVRAVLFPTRRNIIRCAVKCGDGVKDNLGQPCEASKAIRDALTEAKNTATFPVTLYDINGDTKYVKFLPSSPWSRITHYEEGKPLEETYFLQLQEISFS